MKRLLILAGASLLFAACAESPTSPSSTRGIAPGRSNHDDFKCASGYIVAYDENGNPYCVPDDAARTASSSGTTTGGTTVPTSGRLP